MMKSENIKSEDIKGFPMGSGIVIRMFLNPGVTRAGILLANKGEPLPVGEVLKIGPDVKHVKEGQWVTLNSNCRAGIFSYEGAKLGVIKEYDVSFVYEEQPDINDLVAPEDSSITRDLTEYVKHEKMAA